MSRRPTSRPKPPRLGPLAELEARREPPPAGLRDRPRADGSWRLWWEPSSAARQLGFEPVELDPNRLTWSLRQAAGLNRKVLQAREGVTLTAGATRTVSALAARYRQSPAWTKLRPATQRDYDATLRRIEKKWGDARAATFTKPIVYEWFETLHRESGESLAVHDVRVFSVLFSYGERIGWVQHNPATRLKLTTPPPRDRVLSWEEFDALLAAAERKGWPGMALAIALAWYQGQRQADVLAATLGEFGADDVWRFARSKARAGSSQKSAAIPLHSELLPRIAARRAELEAAGADPDAPMIAREDGAAYLDDHFRHRFAEIRKAAAKRMPSLRDVQFRDLRRSWAWWSREGGSTERDRADGLGNQSDKNARLGQTYNPASFAGAKRAVEAMRRPGGPAADEPEDDR
ncbi:hypothetical protein P2H44_22810 [Albimonas sp. CAU 1670]|uniref:tyrosine-type recombinase/integrase n=1 Tax=Albimonas sp. CAU 1670 TaxID=3032599 RepID=UPI0023DC1033|nr:hypothetical protein [Albimonas sp. CAU 1670]MDF2235397.1 hypothetical protein [Albimonas sp. CAU 1670]